MLNIGINSALIYSLNWMKILPISAYNNLKRAI